MVFSGRYRIILAMLIWGSTAIFVRLINIPSYSLLFISYLIAIPLVLALEYKRNNLREIVCCLSRDKFLVIPVIISSVINGMSFFESINRTSVAISLTLHYTAPIFVAIFAPVILKEKLNRKIGAALALSVLGLAIIFFSKNVSVSAKDFSGVVFGLISGISYAFFIIYTRRASAFIKSDVLLFLQLLGNMLIIAPILLFTGLQVFVPKFYLVAIFAVVHITAASLIYFSGFKDTSSHEIGILGYFEMVFAIFYAFLILKETPKFNEILGGLSIIIAGILVI